MRKIALGTVQFGLNYGVTNLRGKTELSELEGILKCARENGIDILDTAPDYGDSEQVLGKVGVKEYRIVTKTESVDLGSDAVIRSFMQSLDSLQIDNVYGLLIRAKDAYQTEIRSLYAKISQLKEQGVIEKIGFSVYSADQVDFLLNHFDFDLIQLPFNVFDSRLVQSGKLKLLKSAGVEVHARSVFLQGVLLDFDNLPQYFQPWNEQFAKYQEMVFESGMSLLEYSLNFVLNTPEIDKVLIGVGNQKQLEEILQSEMSSVDLKPFPIDDVNLLNPSLWGV